MRAYVIDYATKLVLAGPVTATQTHRDAIASVRLALDRRPSYSAARCSKISPTR
jgi:hypothetical protein